MLIVQSSNELRSQLNKIDRKSYPVYKNIRGMYQFDAYILFVDHVQGDPFASPSKLSVVVKGKEAGFPIETYDRRYKRIAIQDYLTRQFYQQISAFSFRTNGSGKSGLISVSRCGQEVLERSTCRLDEKNGDIALHFEVGFPANGRTINAKELIKILFDFLPKSVKKALFYRSLDASAVKRTVALAEDQQSIREQLPKLGLIAFIADKAVLPRESGVSRKPMKGAVAFYSPESMAVTLELPNYGTIRGMGIKKGINLIVGGGYHGKSTLLKALEMGVYNHITGDGREYVITDATAMKIRAEDGRSIKNVDISMFINGLPNGKDTKSFNTEDASGSTSQAANVIEAFESRTSLLLIDEDTSATNFMIRDQLMQEVVHRDSEPITPFINRVREIYERLGVSVIIVVGSSGAYFHEADCIVQMDQYQPKEITDYAKRIAKMYPASEKVEQAGSMPEFNRCPRINKRIQFSDRIKIKSLAMDAISINKENVDLRLVEQLIDPEQLAALGYLLVYAQKHIFDGKQSLQSVVKRLCALMEKDGIQAICEGHYLPCNLAMPRSQEIFACLNRYRGLNL